MTAVTMEAYGSTGLVGNGSKQCSLKGSRKWFQMQFLNFYLCSFSSGQ